MKSAFELAMERLGGKIEKLSDEKKNAIAEVTKKYNAKIAEVKLAHEQRLAKENDPEKIKELEECLVTDIASLKDRCERAKEEIRNSK
ncbi:MAG: hypothetical protein J6S53_05215 [Lentisphaeria bacterium]|nr:hypothetical protein [Lentisphaeria bacterium]